MPTLTRGTEHSHPCRDRGPRFRCNCKRYARCETQMSFDSFSCRNCGDMRHGSKLAKICVSLSVEDWPCFMALPRLPRLPTSGLSAPIWKRSPQPTFQ